MIFTDGSSIPNQGTACAAIMDRKCNIACRINDEDKASAFEAEVLAVKIGLDVIIKKYYDSQNPFRHSSKKINFFIDNQATIQSISHPPKPISNQIIFHEIYLKMKILIEILDFDISLFWCPAHVEVDENEAVNQLAKLATEGNMLCIRNCKQTLANIQQIARKKFKIDKKKRPITRNNIQLTTLPYN
jgi:ribonuclease HI